MFLLDFQITSITMTEYAVGSVASALSQKSTPAAEVEPKKKSKKKPAEPQKNQEVLNQLFAVANVSTPVIVSNVPIPVAPVKKLKRNKRHTDQVTIIIIFFMVNILITSCLLFST